MNIALIGMSGVGKSRIGKQLSEKLNNSFIDIDRIIEKNFGKKLQDVIDCLGEAEFLALEEKVILNIEEANNTVISLGGSSVYSDKAMNSLKSTTKIVFLNASLEEIKRRTADFSERGIVGLKEKGLQKLFEERLPLYRKHADITIEMKNFDDRYIVNLIIENLCKINT